MAEGARLTINLGQVDSKAARRRRSWRPLLP